MEDEKDRREEEEPLESNAARRLKALGGSEPEPEEPPVQVNRAANFWYHHKAVILIAAAFAVILTIVLVQMLGRSNPDVYLLYAGPEYVTPNQNQAFCDLLETMIPDYNGDGKVYVQLNDMVFLTDSQVEAYQQRCIENHEDMKLDLLENRQVSERFTYEIFGDTASVCILAEDQYRLVAEASGFVPLSELFADVPEGAIDDCGIRLSETKFCRFYDAAQVFPEDAVLALRKLSTASVITGVKSAEERHGYAVDLFEAIVSFEYPEGYVPPDEKKN